MLELRIKDKPFLGLIRKWLKTGILKTMDRYIYPAVFEAGENKGHAISFPDLPGCITEGDSMEEAEMAKRRC